jgi:hypothetical protein
MLSSRYEEIEIRTSNNPIQFSRSLARSHSCTLCDDSQDSTKNKNPLVRALAIRTMGCIRVEQITEYLCQPLQLCLKVWMDGWMDRFMHDSRDSGGDLRVSIGAVRLVDLACTYVGLGELILGRGSIRA